MRWTSFRPLATLHDWSSDSLDHDGPAVYELAIAGPRGGGLRTVYLGETGNERRRLAAYGRDGSHLGEIIAWHMRQGWHLHYRAVALPSKEAARTLQNRLLARFDYDWNLSLNA